MNEKKTYSIYEIAEMTRFPSDFVLEKAKKLGLLKAIDSLQSILNLEDTARLMEDLKGGISTEPDSPDRPKEDSDEKVLDIGDEIPPVEVDKHPYIGSILVGVAKKYPDLEMLDVFKWPNTEVEQPSGDGKIDTSRWPDIGLLSTMGYHVGQQKGVATKWRRIILSHVFTSDRLPMVNNLRYMEKWGRKKTAKRLLKIVVEIRSFCRNMVRNMEQNDIDGGQAVREWKEDLEWLRKTYHIPLFSSRIRKSGGNKTEFTANQVPEIGTKMIDHRSLPELMQDKLKSSSTEARDSFHTGMSEARMEVIPYYSFILFLKEILPQVLHGEQVDAFGFVGVPEAQVTIEERFGDKALNEIHNEIRQAAIGFDLLPDVAVAIWDLFRNSNATEDIREIAIALSSDDEFISRIFSSRALPCFLKLIPDSHPAARENTRACKSS